MTAVARHLVATVSLVELGPESTIDYYRRIIETTARRPSGTPSM
jgi:hypothetical protein